MVNLHVSLLRPIPLSMKGNLLNDACVFQVINFSSGQVGYGQNEFTRRVGFSVSMPSANLSFYINDTQESDSGLYVCIVIIPGAPSISGQIQLNVKGNGAERQSHFKGLRLIWGWGGGSLPRLENPEHGLPDQRKSELAYVWKQTVMRLLHICVVSQWINAEVQVHLRVTGPILSSKKRCVSLSLPPQSRPLLPSAA